MAYFDSHQESYYQKVNMKWFCKWNLFLEDVVSTSAANQNIYFCSNIVSGAYAYAAVRSVGC